MAGEKKTPLVIAHRGARDLAPENTIKACQLAIDKGADALELDIRFCKNNKIVIYHDAFLYNHFGKLKRVANVNIEYLYTFAEKSSELSTIAVLRLDDNENGIKFLTQNGFKVVESFT